MVSFELGQINESLDGFTAEAGNIAEVVMPSESHSAESEKIFSEAGLLAKQKLKFRFPDLHSAEPTATPT